MKILMLHNYYQLRGGEGVSFSVEKEILRQLGHEVDTITLDNAVDLIKYNDLHLAARSIWSYESYKRVKERLKSGNFDLMHVQNFFPLFSPSIFDAAAKCNVPVVQALRNYRLFCMEAGLFKKGELCDQCLKKGSSLPGLQNRCYKNDFRASLAHAALLDFHKYKKTWHKKVHSYVAVSSFVKEKYIEAGWSPQKIYVKYNSVKPVPEPGAGDGNFFVVVGRLSNDKGIEELLSVWKCLMDDPAKKTPRLKIIGNGPSLDKIRLLIIKLNLSLYVEANGRLSLVDTYKQIGKATATIVPSIRFEPCSRTIAESYAKGTPVIATMLGGNSELVEDRVSGYLIEAHNMSEMTKAIDTMNNLEHKCYLNMRWKCVEKFQREFSPEKNGKCLENIYMETIRRHESTL